MKVNGMKDGMRVGALVCYDILGTEVYFRLDRSKQYAIVSGDNYCDLVIPIAAGEKIEALLNRNSLTPKRVICVDDVEYIIREK